MLKPKEIKVIQEYLEGNETVQKIAENNGYADRSSVYHILGKEEAKEMMENIANESVQKAINILKHSTCIVARRLVEIAKGTDKDIDKQTVYATLNAINSVLEKSGLSTKNITLQDLREKDNSISSDDILTSIDEFDDKIINIAK